MIIAFFLVYLSSKCVLGQGLTSPTKTFTLPSQNNSTFSQQRNSYEGANAVNSAISPPGTLRVGNIAVPGGKLRTNPTQSLTQAAQQAYSVRYGYDAREDGLKNSPYGKPPLGGSKGNLFDDHSARMSSGNRRAGHGSPQRVPQLGKRSSFKGLFGS